MTTVRQEALSLVNDARVRAEALRDAGRIRWTSADLDCPDRMWLAALMEELGEVGRCVHDGVPDAFIVEELAQLAGVAVGRIEALLAQPSLFAAEAAVGAATSMSAPSTPDREDHGTDPRSIP